jgi:hypothetical protein
MPGYNRNDYEDVDTRLHKFWEAYPNGRIHTELVYQDEKRFIVKAYAYRDYQDEAPSSTGYAEEWVGSSNVNKTSALENGETSAVGRALANFGLSPKGKRPSREEMDKAERQAQDKPAKETMTAEQHAALLDAMIAAPKMGALDQLAKRAAEFDMTDEQRAVLRDAYLESKHNFTEAVDA